MPRRVHEVQLVRNAVFGGVFKAHGLRFDGNAALTLDIGVIKHLLAHLALFKPAAGLDQAIRQCGFAMVDMRDNREVADMF